MFYKVQWINRKSVGPGASEAKKELSGRAVSSKQILKILVGVFALTRTDKDMIIDCFGSFSLNQ